MATKISTNIPLTLTFPFGDSRPVRGDYGIQHRYTVELDGQRDWLYASPSLHLQLQKAGLRPGQAATITKLDGEGNRREWRVELQPKSYAPQFGPEQGNGNGHPVDQAEPPAQPGAPTNGTSQPTAVADPGPAAAGASFGQRADTDPTAGNGRPVPATPAPAAPPSPDFVLLTQGMQYCLATAFEVWEGLPVAIPFTAEDVRTVGITLFLECSRRGVVPQVVEEGLPF